VGVLLAALLIYFLGNKKVDGKVVWTDWQYADPCCTYLFSILVLFTTFGVAKSCIKVLMEATPEGIITNNNY
jgi:zinc transporter 2